MAVSLTKIRSPRYPVIGLQEAIEKAISVYKIDYRNKIPKDLIANHMGYTTLNGKSLGVISAVSKYGLIEGNRDAMWVTDRTVDIAEREIDDPERSKSIRDAANSPEPFRDIDQNFSGRASDAAIRSFLITKRQYLPDSAERLIKSYRETKELVESLDDHKDMEQSNVRDAAPQNSTSEQKTLPTIDQIDAIANSNVNPVSNFFQHGEREWIRGPLSRDTSYRLIISGDIGPKEIGKLIKLLEAQKAVLSDDEDD